MLRLFAILITIVMLPAMAFAWPGKIVAVEEATSFVVLKNGQTPVKVNIAGVEPSPDLDPAKARMESSNNVLMRDVEVRELSKAEDGTIIGDITVNGKSLAKELLDDGIVQSTAQAAPAIDTTPVEIPKEITEPETITEQAPIPPTANADASEITQELLPEPQAQVPDTQAPARNKAQQTTYAQPQPVRYVQAYQPPQQLGLWPARPAPAVSTQQMQQTFSSPQETKSTGADVSSHDSVSMMQKPGDTAKRDYDLAVSVQKKSRRNRQPTGFFTPKRKSETYVGVKSGLHAVMQPKSNVPYESWGINDGISVRHFFPSGVGIGGDFKMSMSNGRSGTFTVASSNSTTSTSNSTTTNSTSTPYDYKKDYFNTYSLTASILYRYYTGKNLTAYIGGSGGYAIYDHPKTEFDLSDGAPIVGAETGLLYRFDSGFTIGGEVNYMTPIGAKKDDPDGTLGTSFNLGYTFN
ncbi:hypothetical protein [Maridesulfovibrio sp.]|uniref:hypothetical protein n=1 Tax=unclassified Maridesulfovibrio TaxID=2794999 RepID=UPI003B00F481